MMNKTFKIIIIIAITIVVIIGTYFGVLGIIKHKKNIQHQNLIKSETEKYNTPNFKDSNSTFLKLPENKEVDPGHFINYEINYKNSGKQEVQNLSIETLIPQNCAL